MNKLTSNPIFRTVGIILILYFALFHNKQDPDSLGNRLSGERLKENLQEMSVKSVDILEGVRKAEELNQKSSPQIFEQNIESKNITLDKNIEDKSESQSFKNQPVNENQNLNKVNNGN